MKYHLMCELFRISITDHPRSSSLNRLRVEHWSSNNADRMLEEENPSQPSVLPNPEFNEIFANLGIK